MALTSGDIFGHGQQSWFPWKNTHSTECPSHGIVLLSDVEKLNNGQWCVLGTRPDKATNVLVAVNGPIPVAPGNYGQLTMDAICFAAYDTADGTPSNGQMWGPDNGTWKLKKNIGSLWHVIGNDSEHGICLIARAGLAAFFGQTDGAVTQNSNGTVEVYSGAAGSESDTNDTETARNAFGDVADNKKTLTLRLNGQNYLVAAECE